MWDVHRKFRPVQTLPRGMPLVDLNQCNESAARLGGNGGSADPMNRPTLYFRLSLVWLAILAGGVAFLLFC